jgi:hypothetical protein
MFRACWGVFSLVTSFYGDDEAKFADKLALNNAPRPFSHRDLSALLALWFFALRRLSAANDRPMFTSVLNCPVSFRRT